MLIKLQFARQIFEKYSVINLHENPSIGRSRIVPCGQTDMTELIVAFGNFANSFKNGRNLETFQKKCFFRNWSPLDRKVISLKRLNYRRCLWLLSAHSYQISVGLKSNHIIGRYAYNVLLRFSAFISEFNYNKSVLELHVESQLNAFCKPSNSWISI